MAHLDTLERRNRTEATSSEDGIHVLTKRDLLWFEKLHRHGPLPTDYLLAYSRILGMADNRARSRLTALFHEKKTPHKGRYLFRPDQQWATPEHNQGLIHDITPYAIQALKEANLYEPLTPVHSVGERFNHDFMRACITASLEIACLRSKRYEFLFHDVRIKGNLYPDRVFGIRDQERDKVIYFALEVDKGTLPITSDATRKTLVQNDARYRDFISNGDYKEALGLKDGLILMNVFNSTQRQKDVMTLVRPSNYIIYKTLPIFGSKYFLTPPLFTQLLTHAWERVDREPFYIAKE